MDTNKLDKEINKKHYRRYYKKKRKKETKPKKPSDINLLDNRIIYLTKMIDREFAEEIISQLLKLDTIKSKKDIIIYINCLGGVVSAGLAIYDALQMLKNDVKIICIGRCCSMAAILLSGGTKGKRYITPNSEVMLHELSTHTMGKIGDIKIDYEHANSLNERLAKLLSENTGQSIEQVKNDIGLRDKWFNAEEAIKYGLADKILTKCPL